MLYSALEPRLQGIHHIGYRVESSAAHTQRTNANVFAVYRGVSVLCLSMLEPLRFKAGKSPGNPALTFALCLPEGASGKMSNSREENRNTSPENAHPRLMFVRLPGPGKHDDLVVRFVVRYRELNRPLIIRSRPGPRYPLLQNVQRTLKAHRDRLFVVRGQPLPAGHRAHDSVQGAGDAQGGKGITLVNERVHLFGNLPVLQV